MTYRENRFGSAPLVPVGDVPTSPLVFKSLWDANTIVKADTDNLPTALEIAEQRLVGRKLGGSISGLTKAEILSIINVTEGADVTGDNAPKAHKASHVDGSDDIRNATVSQKGLATAAQITKLGTIEANADVTDATNVNAAGAVMETDFGAQTLLRAILNNTPLALTVAEQRIVGRITGGNIAALTPAQIRTLINVANGADVTGSNAPQDHTHAATGTQGGPLTLPQVNEAVALTATATNLNLTDDPEFIFELLRRGQLDSYVPSFSWTKVGSGDGWHLRNSAGVFTGATNSSSCIGYADVQVTGPGNILNWVDFSKRHIIGLKILRFGSTANAKGRFQLKDTNAIGQLASFGFGIDIQNLAIYAESYKTARDVTTLGVTMNEYFAYGIIIDHQPGVPQIDYYVDSGSGFPAFGSPTASITDANDIPVAALGGTGYYAFSISKDAVATDCQLYISPIWHWIART